MPLATVEDQKSPDKVQEKTEEERNSMERRCASGILYFHPLDFLRTCLPHLEARFIWRRPRNKEEFERNKTTGNEGTSRDKARPGKGEARRKASARGRDHYGETKRQRAGFGKRIEIEKRK